jgi:hypothetical protein
LKIIVIDDEPFFRDSWSAFLDGRVEVSTYEDPSVLAEDVLSNHIDIEQIDLIITDYFFKRSDLSSMELPDFLRKRGFKGKIWISSNAKEFEIPSGFDGRIAKEPCEPQQLKKLL